MILFPPAKINLGLHVLGKRDDGYHNIDTCMMAIPLYDVLEILPAETFSFTQTGITIDGNQEDNLVVKAFRMMQDLYRIQDVQIHLLKNIPFGAGLGGGSSDATYTLMGLNDFFNLKLSAYQIRELSARIGSDCPFFVESRPQIAQGRGEILTSIMLNLKGYYLQVVNPGIHIGTAEAYAQIGFYKGSKNVRTILSEPIENWRYELTNSFEQNAFKNHPVLVSIKETMYQSGAVYSAMSGSGSTMFGIFKNRPDDWNSDVFSRILEL